MVEFVYQHVRIVEVLLFRNVDRLFTVNITSKGFLLALRQPDSEHGSFDSVVQAEKVKRILRSSFHRNELDYLSLKVSLIWRRIQFGFWQVRSLGVFQLESLRTP